VCSATRNAPEDTVTSATTAVAMATAVTAARLIAWRSAHSAATSRTVNKAPMSASLLGMTFLSRLQSFRVEDGNLILRWREAPAA